MSRVLHIQELAQVVIYHQPSAHLYFYDDTELDAIDSFPLDCHDSHLLTIQGNYLLNANTPKSFQLYRLSDRQLLKTVTIKAASRITALGIHDKTALVGTDAGAFYYNFDDDIDNDAKKAQVGIDSCVVAVAPAPCGGGVWAVAYSSGVVAIYRIADAATCANVQQFEISNAQRMSWHFSCVDPCRQSLAVLAQNTATVWSINITLATAKKIRNVNLPPSYTPSRTEAQDFLKWSKGGQVVRACKQAVVRFEVKTKNVKATTIDLPKPVHSLDVHSASSQCWLLLGQHELCRYDLTTGKLQESCRLPSENTAYTICEGSPVVRMVNMSGKVNEITIKRSPKKQHQQQQQSPSTPQTPRTPPSATTDSSPSKVLFKPSYRESFDFSSYDSGFSSAGESPIFTPTRAFSVDSCSTIDPSPTPTSPTFSVVSCQEVDSLFPEVMHRLLWEPKAVVPYDSAVYTKEQYLIQSLFGIEFADIYQAVEAQLAMNSGNWVLQAVLFDCSPQDVEQPVHKCAAQYLQTQQHDRAVTLYVRHGYYMEALVIALLFDLDWYFVLNSWIIHAGDQEKYTLMAIKSQIGSHRSPTNHCIVNIPTTAPSSTKLHTIPNYSRPAAV